jgi:hypothetical protein
MAVILGDRSHAMQVPTNMTQIHEALFQQLR